MPPGSPCEEPALARVRSSTFMSRAGSGTLPHTSYTLTKRVRQRTFCQAHSAVSTLLLQAVENSADRQTPAVTPSPGRPIAMYWTARITSFRVYPGMATRAAEHALEVGQQGCRGSIRKIAVLNRTPARWTGRGQGYGKGQAWFALVRCTANTGLQRYGGGHVVMRTVL